MKVPHCPATVMEEYIQIDHWVTGKVVCMMILKSGYEFSLLLFLTKDKKGYLREF